MVEKSLKQENILCFRNGILYINEKRTSIKKKKLVLVYLDMLNKLQKVFLFEIIDTKESWGSIKRSEERNNFHECGDDFNDGFH